MNNKLVVIGLSSLLILVGCNNDSNNQKSGTSIENISEVTADNDATTLEDVTALNSDLSSIFGAADGEPIPVEDNDSVQDVIDKRGI